VTMARLRGTQTHAIDYRHVLWSLVKKPGAFAAYRLRVTVQDEGASSGQIFQGDGATPFSTRWGHPRGGVTRIFSG
jgi:hypothetical protein